MGDKPGYWHSTVFPQALLPRQNLQVLGQVISLHTCQFEIRICTPGGLFGSVGAALGGLEVVPVVGECRKDEADH